MLYRRIRAIGAMLKYWGYDIKRYWNHLNYLEYNSTEDRLKGALSMNYHVLEKGLTMPETRLGFGETQVLTLVNLLNDYIAQQYNRNEIEFIQSVMVLNEYLDFHYINNYKIDEKIITCIRDINQRCNIFNSSKQLDFELNEFFSKKNDHFDQFALSRHTVRDYSSKEIPDDIISECVKIAQNAPSSCNRQPIRVYAIKEVNRIKNILQLQSGNRGFGHLASTIFVITSNISHFQNFTERNEPALNAGLFSMSFLYALHFKGIGACALNWSVSIERDKKLRKLISIPDNEMIHLIISSGYPPENFKVAASPRKDVKDVLTILK